MISHTVNSTTNSRKQAFGTLQNQDFTSRGIKEGREGGKEEGVREGETDETQRPEKWSDFRSDFSFGAGSSLAYCGRGKGGGGGGGRGASVTLPSMETTSKVSSSTSGSPPFSSANSSFTASKMSDLVDLDRRADVAYEQPSAVKNDLGYHYYYYSGAAGARPSKKMDLRSPALSRRSSFQQNSANQKRDILGTEETSFGFGHYSPAAKQGSANDYLLHNPAQHHHQHLHDDEDEQRLQEQDLESLSGKTTRENNVTSPQSQTSDIHRHFHLEHENGHHHSHSRLQNRLVDEAEKQSQDPKIIAYTSLFTLSLFIILHTLPPFPSFALLLRASALGPSLSSLTLFSLCLCISFHLAQARQYLYQTYYVKILSNPSKRTRKIQSSLFVLCISYFSMSLISAPLFKGLEVVVRHVPLLGGMVAGWALFFSILVLGVCVVMNLSLFIHSFTAALFFKGKEEKIRDKTDFKTAAAATGLRKSKSSASVMLKKPQDDGMYTHTRSKRDLRNSASLPNLKKKGKIPSPSIAIQTSNLLPFTGHHDIDPQPVKSLFSPVESMQRHLRLHKKLSLHKVE